MKNRLDILEKIQKVEAPDYILTRVAAKIEGYTRVSPLKWAFAVGTILLLISVNTLVYFHQKVEKPTESSYNSSFKTDLYAE